MRTLDRREVGIYAALLALGGLQLLLGCRMADFPYDPYYYELAHSLLAGTGYGFNARPEPMVPPGFPALLSLLILIVGNNFAILIRSMAFFTTFGLIAAYEVLKLAEGRRVAGGICLLLASSPALFAFSTQMLFSDMPYFFTSMCFLLAATQLDSSLFGPKKSSLFWTIICALLLLSSIVIRSTGIALIGGILGWLAVSCLRTRKVDGVRLRYFLPLVIVGLAAQSAWMIWAERHPVSQWPVHGFQESYVAQLKLKNGNNPELGMATWQDVIKRPLQNEDDMVTSVFSLLTHKEVAPAWYSPITVIALLLGAFGFAHTLRKSGGTLVDWYFVSYQLLFLFWPWNYEWRFQVPVAPLAALYMWRGSRLAWRNALSAPQALGAVVFAGSALGVLSSVVWGRSVQHPSARLCVAIWLLVGGLAAVWMLGGRRIASWLSRRLEPGISVGGVRLSQAQLAGAIALFFVLAAGVWMEVLTGLENLRTVPETDPSIEAAEWIRSHTPTDAVVMARWEARVYHYSGHRVIWFPASTNRDLLLAGIRRHHIRLVVVTDTDENNSYWKPSESQCFWTVVRSTPQSFRQIHEGPHERVYEVTDAAMNTTDPKAT
jgi:hypothetical protein